MSAAATRHRRPRSLTSSRRRGEADARISPEAVVPFSERLFLICITNLDVLLRLHHRNRFDRLRCARYDASSESSCRRGARRAAEWNSLRSPAPDGRLWEPGALDAPGFALQSWRQPAPACCAETRGYHAGDPRYCRRQPSACRARCSPTACYRTSGSSLVAAAGLPEAVRSRCKGGQRRSPDRHGDGRHRLQPRPMVDTFDHRH